MKNKITYNYTNTLREHRQKHGLLQAQVAELLGFIGTDRISLWEQGKAIPSLPNLFKMCALYRVSPFDIYTDLADTTEDEVETKKLEKMLK